MVEFAEIELAVVEVLLSKRLPVVIALESIVDIGPADVDVVTI